MVQLAPHSWGFLFVDLGQSHNSMGVFSLYIWPFLIY